MSFNLTTERRHRFGLPTWSGSAFIVEALLLLLFLAASAAIFTQLFAHAATQATESLELSRAVAVANDTAERFAADPDSIEDVTLSDGMVVVCTTTSDGYGAGTLYHATISGYGQDAYPVPGELPVGEPVYSISTARYRGGGAS